MIILFIRKRYIVIIFFVIIIPIFIANDKVIQISYINIIIFLSVGLLRYITIFFRISTTVYMQINDIIIFYIAIHIIIKYSSIILI